MPHPYRVTSPETPEMHARSVSCCVVICTRDRPEQLDACVTAVLAQAHSPGDVLVVDNAPSDSRGFEVAARHGVRYVVEPRLGASHARNRGARAALSAEIIAYVDDDGLPAAGWLRGLCAEFADPRVMCVVGRILPSDPESEGARICAALGILDGGPRRLVVDRDTPDWFDRMREGFGGAANMAIRRDAFAVWPGFDPRLGRGAPLRAGEEDYTYLSLIRHGYRVVHTPAAVVYHPFPATAADVRRNHLRTMTEGAAYLAFILAEEPACRRAIVRHLLHRLRRGRRRSFRRAPAEARRLAPYWREVWAGIEGLGVFARFALARGRRASDAARAPALLPQALGHADDS